MERLSLIIIVTIAVIVIIRKKISNKVASKVMLSGIALFYVFMIFLGPSFRLTPTSTARANAFISKDDVWLAQVKLADNEVHMFYDKEDDFYRTVFVDKLLIGYRSNTATHCIPHKEDIIQSLGVLNIEDNGRRFSAHLIKTLDANVKVIGIVNEEGNVLYSKSIKVDELTTIAYEYQGRDNCFNSKIVAFDENMKELYYFGYEDNDNTLTSEDYKWYEFN